MVHALQKESFVVRFVSLKDPLGMMWAFLVGFLRRILAGDIMSSKQKTELIWFLVQQGTAKTHSKFLLFVRHAPPPLAWFYGILPIAWRADSSPRH